MCIGNVARRCRRRLASALPDHAHVIARVGLPPDLAAPCCLREGWTRTWSANSTNFSLIFSTLRLD
jgi:hypothetical protein